MSEASILLKRTHAAREGWLELDSTKKLKLRRPTEVELVRLRRGAADGIELGLEVIESSAVDWEGFREADFVPSGSDDAVAFDRALYREWVGDRPHLWQAISDRLFGMIEAHAKTLEADAKN